MVNKLKRIIAYSILISIFGVFIYFALKMENKSFNSVGNVFSNSETSNKNRDQKEIELSDDFWTSGRFSF